MVIEDQTADHRDQGPVEPRHGVRVDQSALVETEMTTVRQLYVHGVLMFTYKYR